MQKQLEMTTQGAVSCTVLNNLDVFFPQKITDNLHITVNSRTSHVFTSF
jgi:hypothetical protein